MSPDWFGSPQHVVGGIALALVVYAACRYFGLQVWLAAALAIGAVSMTELLIELVEYPLLYSDHFHHSAYYDTLADMASTLVGGVIGAVAGVCWSRRRARSVHH